MAATKSPVIEADVLPAEQGRRVDGFVDLGPTPGNVGLAFCGGGSRAMSAGLGQLRGLATVTSEAGKRPLLGLAKAISAVSGGAWLTAPFMFLPESITDEAYLGTYVADPGRLVARRSLRRTAAEELDQMAAGYAGQSIGHPRFTVPGLALQLVFLKHFGKVATPRLWQTLVGLNILKPFGLYEKGAAFAPTSTFSYDRKSLQEDVLAPNPHLQGYTVHLVASGDGRIRRPFWICNTSMFVNEPEAAGQDLVPVQSTPFFTGIMSEPGGKDPLGRPVGGGGVASFAFDSKLQAQRATKVKAGQPRPFSLTDIVGLSSVAFASALEQQVDQWRKDHVPLAELMLEKESEMEDWLKEHFGDSKLAGAVDNLLHRPELQAFLKKAGIGDKIDADLHKAIEEIQSLIPEASYWPVHGAGTAKREPDADAAPTCRFADGGNLENTGVAALLTYTDIDRIVAFVNSPTSMRTVDVGVLSAAGGPDKGAEVEDTRILIDGQIPILFGYRYHRDGLGYQLYRDAEDGTLSKEEMPFRVAQVFPEEDFPALVRGLWSASHGLQRPAVFEQSLETVDNGTFGIRGGRKVKVLWFYLDKVQDWLDLLSRDVQGLLAQRTNQTFPNYPTNQGLRPNQINLLAHLTSWCVADASNRGIVERFFTD